MLWIQSQVLLFALYWLGHLPSPDLFYVETCVTQCFVIRIQKFFSLVSCKDGLAIQKIKGKKPQGNEGKNTNGILIERLGALHSVSCLEDDNK